MRFVGWEVCLIRGLLMLLLSLLLLFDIKMSRNTCNTHLMIHAIYINSGARIRMRQKMVVYAAGRIRPLRYRPHAVLPQKMHIYIYIMRFYRRPWPLRYRPHAVIPQTMHIYIYIFIMRFYRRPYIRPGLCGIDRMRLYRKRCSVCILRYRNNAMLFAHA